MDIISIKKVENLFWLGRYTERVVTTLKNFHKCYDTMIDKDENAYIGFCEKLEIPNIYESKDVFIKKYLFDSKNVDSVYNNLLRAFDNAVVIRDELSTQSLAYIQMALDELKNIENSEAKLMEIQTIIDYLLAFWGSIDDYVGTEQCINFIKLGKYVEKVDLYIRLSYRRDYIKKEVNYMKNYLYKLNVNYNEKELDNLIKLINEEGMYNENYYETLRSLNKIFEV